MWNEAIYVVSLGASTVVGQDAWSSAAAVRAGICGFTLHPYMVDMAGQPLRIARAPWLDIRLTGIERFKALLLPAIDQVFAAITEEARGDLRIALSLGLPPPRIGLARDLQPLMITAIGDRYPHLAGIASFPNGHAAGLLALNAAFGKLEDGSYDGCVVAAVDSYIQPYTLEWLEEQDQLHGAGLHNNAWGFIPGEGAGALLLARRSVVERLGLDPLARITGVGIAFEPKRIKTETICIGEGLTKAFRSVLDRLPNGVKVSDLYCDMNGEPYRADEYGFSCLRTKEYFHSASNFIAPADSWGDISAAGAPLHMQLAVIAGIKGYANGTFAMVWASSEAGDRAAAVLELRRLA